MGTLAIVLLAVNGILVFFSRGRASRTIMLLLISGLIVELIALLIVTLVRYGDRA